MLQPCGKSPELPNTCQTGFKAHRDERGIESFGLLEAQINATAGSLFYCACEASFCSRYCLVHCKHISVSRVRVGWNGQSVTHTHGGNGTGRLD